jgi:hypothetical protein
MLTKKAAFVGMIGAAALSLGVPGAAGASTVAAQGAAPAAAPQASLNCKTSVGHTGGWVECKGKGTWRVKSICDNETDKYTTWHSQRGGTQRIYAVDCTFKMDDVTYEVK